MNSEHEFEVIEHTADVGVIGKGRTMADAFESAAYGMFSIMADIGKYQATKTKVIRAKGHDDIALFQSFLANLITLFETERVLPVDFQIEEISMGRLTCYVMVRPIDNDIEWIGPQIKAVTFHQMAIWEENGMWHARAIFDV